MDLQVVILIAIIGVVVGLLVIGFIFNKKQISQAFETSQKEAKAILEDASKEADRVVKEALQEAKNESRKRKKTFEEEAKKKRAEISRIENKIKQKEKSIDAKFEEVEKREEEAIALSKKLANDEKRQHRLIAEAELAIENNQKTLEKIANMSAEEAKKELLKSLEETAKKESRGIIRKIEEEAKKEAEKKAQAIVSLAVQRVAGDYVNDSTVSVVSLPGEEMKGRIIGREGRNIRALEQSTGVDLIIDDTPEAVIISCFHPIRREIAKITLERLIADGRIHPARIEETAKRVESEFESILKEYGEQAAFDIGITDLNPELLSYLGKLRFRTSGVQTVLQHSIETAQICGIIAAELGLNVKIAKRVGLLHDIGKAVDHETEGDHSVIGANLCEKMGEHPEVVEAIKDHHKEDLTQASALSVALYASNKLSASRPGARKEVMEAYVKRLSDIEELIKGFEGIENAYVLQAGREVRAIVSQDGIEDTDVVDLSNDIASKLRQEVNFPGQIKVTVLKESKFMEYAK